MKILRFSSSFEVKNNMSACSPVGPACNCISQCSSLCNTVRYSTSIVNSNETKDKNQKVI